MGVRRLTSLCEELFDDLAVDIGEAVIAALKVVGELGVVKAEQVK